MRVRPTSRSAGARAWVRGAEGFSGRATVQAVAGGGAQPSAQRQAFAAGGGGVAGPIRFRDDQVDSRHGMTHQNASPTLPPQETTRINSLRPPMSTRYSRVNVRDKWRCIEPQPRTGRRLAPLPPTADISLRATSAPHWSCSRIPTRSPSLTVPLFSSIGTAQRRGRRCVLFRVSKNSRKSQRFRFDGTSASQPSTRTSTRVPKLADGSFRWHPRSWHAFVRQSRQRDSSSARIPLVQLASDQSS